MFLPVVSSSVIKLFFYSVSTVEAVSASVRDSKGTLSTPQANFLKKQFSYNWFPFSVYLNTEIELNWILLLTIGISFPRSVRATCAE